MTMKMLRSIHGLQPAALAGAVCLSLLPACVYAQNAHSIPPPPVAPQQSPFAGTVVEDILVRVNDQIISKSDYDRQLEEMEASAHQQNWSPQQLEEQKKNLLRDMVDQQLLLSKGKELGITGETEMIKQLDTIRKQNNLDSMEALEAAAKSQGVSFEDFKQHVRDRIITQQVIGQEVYRKVNITQADLQRFYDAHKAEFDKPESVRLSEILIPTENSEDAAQVTAAQAKAQDVYAKLQGGAKFDELAKSTSAGQTAAQGGDLGEFKRGQLAKVLEDATFALKPGQYTQPIRTKQGFVILDTVAHRAAGVPPLKDVLPQVEEALGAERTEPALRLYLKQLREEAYIDYKPGYVDTAAVINPSKPNYSAYAPPAPKKKRRVERTRFRQRAHGAEPKQAAASAPAAPVAAPAATSAASTAPPPNVPSLADAPGAATASENNPAQSAPATTGEATTGQAATGQATTGQVATSGTEDQVGVSNPAVPTPAQPAASSSSQAPAATAAPAASSRSRATSKAAQVASSTTQKPGKREKIRFGQAPTKTLPAAAPTQTVDAGANGTSAASDTTTRNGMAPETQVAANADAPEIGEGSTAPEKKSRFSDRARLPKEKKSKEAKIDPFAPPSVSAEEVADRQTQAAPLGLAGDTTKSKKPKPTEKTRLQDKTKSKDDGGSAEDANAPATDTVPPAAPPVAAPPAAAPAMPPPPAQPQ